MIYGLCNLGIVGIRNCPSDKSELISQILYGECFKLLEQKDKWSRIKLNYDNYEGWIDNKQFKLIDKLKKGNDPNGSVENPDKIVSFSEIK